MLYLSDTVNNDNDVDDDDDEKDDDNVGDHDVDDDDDADGMMITLTRWDSWTLHSNTVSLHIGQDGGFSRKIGPILTRLGWWLDNP